MEYKKRLPSLLQKPVRLRSGDGSRSSFCDVNNKKRLKPLQQYILRNISEFDGDILGAAWVDHPQAKADQTGNGDDQGRLK